MRIVSFHALLFFLVFMVVSAAGRTADEGLAAYWKFDEENTSVILDAVSSYTDSIYGNLEFVSGVSGDALKFDGFTAFVIRDARQVPEISGAFSIEAWIALGSYPWNWCPLIDHHESSKAGYFFGIGPEGHLKLELSAGGEWQSVISKTTMPYREWVHVAGVYDPENGISVYINGNPEGILKVTGNFSPANGLDMLFCRGREKGSAALMGRSGLPPASIAFYNFFDGILDEVKIYACVLSGQEIQSSYQENLPKTKPQLQPRRLPSGPDNSVKFGAYSTKLNYYDEWDALWRVDDNPDVVVRFDEAPYKLVFWRGTGYIPCWVTGNNIWYTNEFNEAWGHGADGCAEPMSDKHCRYSHVRIIENNDARVVIHWRYALVDIRYERVYVDPYTNRSDWSDELYTIYPDGTGIRKITLHSSFPMDPHEFQESIVVTPPGVRPEECIERDAVTMANMNGETRTYSLTYEGSYEGREPENPNIKVINIKSKTRPFIIVEPDSNPYLVMFNDSGLRNLKYSTFHWRSHWPTTQVPIDGRWNVAPDRAAHIHWGDYEVTPSTRVKIMLHGLTDKPASELALFARSWAQAPELRLGSNDFITHGYDVAQRAYVVTCKRDDKNPTLEFELEASNEYPVVNPAFVIENWGEREASLTINGKNVERGKNFRYGLRHNLESTDLIVWIKSQSTAPVTISLTPVD